MTTITRGFRRLWRALQSAIRRRRVYQTVYMTEEPEVVKAKRLYIIGENGFLWSAALKCPCGCGSAIRLNLLSDAHPAWKVTKHADNTVSIHPSIWSKRGCGSHYFLKRGIVRWCAYRE